MTINRTETINRTDLVNQVAEAAGLKKSDASAAVDAVFEAITTGLQQRAAVRILGFGTFRVAHRGASEGRNPRTGEKIQLAASDAAKFVPGKALKAALNAPARKVGGARNSPMRRTG